MNKAFFITAIITLFFLVVLSCKKDDAGIDVIPPRDRGEEMLESMVEIDSFLITHFYNYDEFENPPADFNFRIKLDTIAGDNASKTPLMEQVSFKNVKDRIDESVTYKLYYLNTIQGNGESPNFPDMTIITYEGTYLNNESTFNVSNVFDSSVAPIEFDLTLIVPGLQEVLVEFNASTGNVVNSDGTITFENYGVGAAFIPSGLAYYEVTPPGIPIYSQLIFTFQLFETELGDQDGDTIPSIYEDLDGNSSVFNDDTDADGNPNFADVDDEGDGRLTRNEVEQNTYLIEEGEAEPVLASNEVETKREFDEVTLITTITTISFTDIDGDGTPDYLDPDN
jgi:hypothetical protein